MLTGVDDLLYIRSMVQALEGLPVSYLREAFIEPDEIELAVAAFNGRRDPERPDPYVARWDETFAERGKLPPAKMVVGYRLDMMVFDLLKKPDAHRKRLPRLALRAILDDRQIPPENRPKPREAFTGALERQIAYWGMSKPADMVAFGKWVYAEPGRCPGFRLSWELFNAPVANERDVLQESDLWDNAHFPAIPYVDCVTLDRRMAGYSREISARLAKRSPEGDYRARIFRSLRDLLPRLTDREHRSG